MRITSEMLAAADVLSRGQIEILTMHRSDFLSFKRIAKLKSKSVPTIRRTYSRAVERLKASGITLPPMMRRRTVRAFSFSAIDERHTSISAA